MAVGFGDVDSAVGNCCRWRGWRLLPRVRIGGRGPRSMRPRPVGSATSGRPRWRTMPRSSGTEAADPVATEFPGRHHFPYFHARSGDRRGWSRAGVPSWRVRRAPHRPCRNGASLRLVNRLPGPRARLRRESEHGADELRVGIGGRAGAKSTAPSRKQPAKERPAAPPGPPTRHAP